MSNVSKNQKCPLDTDLHTCTKQHKFLTYLKQKYSKQIYLPLVTPSSKQCSRYSKQLIILIHKNGRNAEFHVNESNKKALKNVSNKQKKKKHMYLIYISNRDNTYVHANALLCFNRRAYLYEPYGGSGRYKNVISSTVKQFIETYYSNFEFLAPPDWHPLADQHDAVDRKLEDPEGYCSAWCFFFMSNMVFISPQQYECNMKSLTTAKKKQIIRNFTIKLNCAWFYLK